MYSRSYVGLLSYIEEGNTTCSFLQQNGMGRNSKEEIAVSGTNLKLLCGSSDEATIHLIEVLEVKK